MKNVLVLGAGLVSQPLIRFLMGQSDLNVCVAGLQLDNAEPLMGPRGKLVRLDIRNRRKLAALAAEADLVVSLLPSAFHAYVAELCLQYCAHLVTTSYVSEAMRGFDDEARRKGLLFLNEIGLDPGIDHLSAMRIIDAVHAEGGKIVSFTSCCGGLPAPEANDNPFGYKFSWNPRGVLLAGRQPARYLKDGSVIRIDGGRLFQHYWQENVGGLGALEVYPNRDSLIYQGLYGLDEANTLLRGTLRYPGWCDTLDKLAQLGLLDDRSRPELAGKSWNEIIAHLIRHVGVVTAAELADFLSIAADDPIMGRLQWLGLLSWEKPQAEPLTLLDALVHQMIRRMAYRPGERDLIVLQHRFEVVYTDRKEQVISLLTAFGQPHGDTAMALTVGLPAAMAVKLMLAGKIEARGVQIPVSAEFYGQILPLLAERGIVFEESRRRPDA